MTSETKPALLRSAPYFPVADLERAAAYYEDVLGFASEYSGGDPPHFAIHARDGLTIMLKLKSNTGKIDLNEEKRQHCDVFSRVDDVRGL